MQKDDVIYRQAAIDGFWSLDVELRPSAINAILNMLNDLPPAQPERKTGMWKTAYLDHEALGERPRIFYCSMCNQGNTYLTNFCPFCGADMRVKVENDKRRSDHKN